MTTRVRSLAALVRVVALLLALVAHAAIAAPLRVPPGFVSAPVGKALEVYVEDGHEAGVEAIASMSADRWRPSAADAPNEGYRPGTLWARLRVDDRRDVAGDLVLEFGYAPADEVSVFVRTERGFEAMHAGDHVRRASWPRATLLPQFPLGIAREQEIYVRVRDASLQVPLVLHTEASAAASERSAELTAAAYYAIVVALALYNLLLFVGTRIRVYLVYVAYVVSFALFFATLDGVGSALLWPNAPLVSDRSPLLFLCVTTVAITYFAAELLALGTGVGPHHRLVLPVKRALVVTSVVTLGAPFPLALVFLTAVGVGGVSFVAVAAVSEALGGSRPARLFLVAFGVFLGTGVAFGLANAGVVSLGRWTTLMLPAGSALELVLLAYALADRIKALQHEATRQAEIAGGFAEEARRSAEVALEEHARTNRELERLAKLKDAFLANTSHELRTPLNGILGLTEVTLGGAAGAVPSGVARNLGIIRSSARRLGSLVNDILDFSKLREGKLALRLEPVALHDEVAAVLSVLEPLAADKSLRVVSEVDEGSWVRADANRLQQILTNLIGNAIKFTRAGSVVVRASREGARVVIAVHDTGVGIAASEFARIFESFEQGDGSASRAQGGTGLGLAVTRQLVELHGGHVRVDSRVGEGSTFTFDLEAGEPGAREGHVSVLARDDAAKGERGDVPDERIVDPLPALDGHTLRVLVVDDEPVNRDVLAQHLVARGFRTELVASGQEAIARLWTAPEDERADLVLLDVMMPEVTGYDVLREVRPRFDREELPIVMLTAKAQESDLARGFALGANDYLLKPLSFVELDARLSHHVDLVLARRAERAELEARRALQGELASTEAKLADAQAMATLGTMVAGIAHDLRNPLQFVLSAVETLREAEGEIRSEDATVREQALERVGRATSWVETGAMKMEALSRAMRNQARTDRDRVVLPLREAVDEAWLLCRGRVADVSVTFDVTDDAILVDPIGFGQLVMNLLSNAADALHEHGVRPGRPEAEGRRIHLEARVAEGVFAVAIHDNGPGVPEELRVRVKEAFFTTKKRGLGTGLGLAIVGRVAEAHGGSLAIDDSPILGGARFEVAWPNGP